MRLRWPPLGLGLGTPLNSALATAELRRGFVRCLWLYLMAGLAAAAVVIGLDQLLFSGVSLERIRALGSVPLPLRGLTIVEAAAGEELFYRLGVATLIAWIALLVASRLGRPSTAAATWIGILGAALLFGLAHVGNVPNAPHPYFRAIVLNGFLGIVLGWLYWRRGLEAAILAHLAGDAFIYLFLPSTL